jgi:DNA gyrase/topoisomerase IV subunit B
MYYLYISTCSIPTNCARIRVNKFNQKGKYMSIRKLSDREHVQLRPAMYIGAVNTTKTNEYILEDGKIQYKEVSYVPGLIKIINEIIDNSVDVAIKSNFKDCDNISVNITNTTVEVQDNGCGIPVQKNEDGQELAELAWGHSRAGSNFDDDDNRTQIGMNGVGSFATNCFSSRFVGHTDDGKKKYTITFVDNAESFTDKVQKSSGTTGVNVKFWPDLEKFGLEAIDDIHMNVIKQRLINLSLSFPEITFKFNGKKINVNSFKKYIHLFNDNSEIYETEDYKFAILPNAEDDFRQFSYVNGLKIPDGGTHIDIISGRIVDGLRDKLKKKYKTIKPGDIKNKLMVIAFLKNVKNTKFNSQSKEKITNGTAEINEYFGDIPFDKIINSIFKNKEIIDPITEIWRIKEEFKRRAELKGLSKTTKKIKSDKYLPSIGVKKYLLLVEGESALGGLSPVLGRKECGYYVLKGKPLNAYSAPQSKFTQNKELSELYKIIQNENYQYIIYGTDQDLDGYHIRGLLTGFFVRYMPELKGRIGMLQTPVIAVSKKDKLTSWHYNMNADVKVKAGEKSDYKKGLGSWDIEDLKEVVKVDGLKQMINIIDFNNEEIIDDWLGPDSEPRKNYILDNNFSIAKL